MKNSLCVLLMCFCLESFGAVIFINDQQAPLVYKDELYFLPIGYDITTGTTTLYITMDGIRKVCFINRASSVLFQQASMLNIIIHGVKTEWNCFPYKTTVYPVMPW